MNIRIGKYELQPSVGSLERWDLVEYVERTKKDGGGTYESTNALAYSITLAYALQTIIGMRLAEREDTVTLEEYVALYIAEKTGLETTIKSVINTNT